MNSNLPPGCTLRDIDPPQTIGEDACEDCQGTGLIDGEECEACKGTGVVEYDIAERDHYEEIDRAYERAKDRELFGD